MPGLTGPPDKDILAAAAAQSKQEAARRQQEAARAQQAAARRQQEQQEQREKHDLALRAGYIRQGIERPPEEFLALGVVVGNGRVREWSTTVVRVLGPLAGAQAGIAGPMKTSGAVSAAALTVTFGAAGAVAALARRGTKPFAYVVFPDGTLYQTPLADKKFAARAQADVLRFNALAETARTETARKGEEHS
jgi:hypothetical protein